jgi:protease-4
MPIAEGRVWLGAQAKANGLVDELGGLDRAMEMIRQKAKIGADERLNLVLYPAKRSVYDLLMRNTPEPGSDALARAIGLRPRSSDSVDAALQSAGLGPLRTVWHDARLRIWLRGGMLRMMPFALDFK